MLMTGLVGLFGRGTVYQGRMMPPKHSCGYLRRFCDWVSATAVFWAMVISFFFFAFALYAQPFSAPGLNVSASSAPTCASAVRWGSISQCRRAQTVKIVSEFQLFIVLAICLVLQTDSRGLVADSRDSYGMGLIAATLLSLPVLVRSTRLLL